MKRLLFTGIMAAAMMFAGVLKAEATTTITVVICQGGLLCQTFGPTVGTTFGTPGPITVGDYTVDGSVSTNENPLLSNAATTTIAIKRLTTTNAGALQIYLAAQGYTNPLPPNYNLAETLSATSSGAPTGSTVTFQGWANFSNSAVLLPSPTGTTPGLQTCNLLAATDACLAAVRFASTGAGAVPFSLLTLTTFNVATASASATYTTNAQINIAPNVVPEPASMLLLGSGLVGLAMAVRRRRS